MLTLSWTGQSIRNSQARRVRSDIIFLNFENEIFYKLKNFFFSSHFSWKGNKGYLARASNISCGPIWTRRVISKDDQPAEVTTPDEIIRARGSTVTFICKKFCESPPLSIRIVTHITSCTDKINKIEVNSYKNSLFANFKSIILFQYRNDPYPSDNPFFVLAYGVSLSLRSFSRPWMATCIIDGLFLMNVDTASSFVLSHAYMSLKYQITISCHDLRFFSIGALLPILRKVSINYYANNFRQIGNI